MFGQERETLEEAFPGDVVGLVNATDVRVGDSLYGRRAVEFPAIPSFAPEHFAVARTTDTGKFKQFRNGIAQLDEEGVVQVLRDADLGDQAPVLAAVGPDAVRGRRSTGSRHEFGAPVELSQTATRWLAGPTRQSRPALRAMQGVDVLERSDGTLLAVFESVYWLDRLLAEQPELTLERLVAEGELRQA